MATAGTEARPTDFSQFRGSQGLMNYCFGTGKTFLQATRYYSLNLTTKPRLAISRGHKDGSLVVHREGQFGPVGVNEAHQGD
jgi:hypothetical protein